MERTNKAAIKAAEEQIDEFIVVLLYKLAFRHPHWPQQVIDEIKFEAQGELYLIEEITQYTELAEVLADGAAYHAERDAARAGIEHVRELHTEFRLYDDCGHLHDEEGDADVKAIVEDLGPVCQDGYVSSICRTCCAGGGDGQTSGCVDAHDGPCWPCATVRALGPSDAAGRP